MMDKSHDLILTRRPQSAKPFIEIARRSDPIEQQLTQLDQY
jgi:hypothetical protein